MLFQSKKSSIEFEKLIDYIFQFLDLYYLSSNFNNYQYFRRIVFPEKDSRIKKLSVNTLRSNFAFPGDIVITVWSVIG
jgi:hypothetical protein